MTLDDELNTAAEEYARTLFDLGRLKHAKVEGQGENLAMGCSTGAEGRTVQDAVKSWFVGPLAGIFPVRVFICIHY